MTIVIIMGRDGGADIARWRDGLVWSALVLTMMGRPMGDRLARRGKRPDQGKGGSDHATER